MWVVPSDLLARARFVVSPKAEVAAALSALLRPVDPAERAFAAAHHDAFREMLHAHPARAAIVAVSFRPRSGSEPGWIANYLAAPPHVPNPSFEDELAVVEAMDDVAFRSDLETTARRRLPPELEETGVVRPAVELLDWLWTRTVATDWPHRRRVLEADIVARTAQLGRRGWAGVLQGLGKHREWLEDGRIRINRYDLPDRVLPDRAQLSFVPVLTSASWVGWDSEDRYSVYYPVAGRLASTGGGEQGGLDALIGPNRAMLLRLLQTPATTSGLAERTGLPLGSVGNHLAVLLRSGAVLRRRAGHSVIYWQSPLGQGLAAADGTTSAPIIDPDGRRAP
jgi:hypothetical protein